MALRTQIYLNGTALDLKEDIAIPATYSIIDIREPDKRTFNYTKTVALPGSKENNKMFSHIWNLGTVLNTSGVTTTNFNPNFNPNLKADVLVLIDGVTTFKGYLQLNSIDIDNSKYEYVYNCTLFGNIANIFQTLGDSRLSDLDLSEYNHTYNKTNQINSWDTSVIKNGSGYVNFSGGVPTGEGYVYPMIDYGYTNGTSYDVTHFFPAVYAKTIVDKIVGGAGFQWSPDFIGSSLFKRLIFPYGGGKLLLSDTDVQNRTFRASNSAETYFAHDNYGLSPYNTLGLESFQDETTTPNFDPGGVYNNSTFRFTASKPGSYNIKTELYLSLTHYPKTSTVNYAANDVYERMGVVAIRRNGSFPLNSVYLGMLQGATAAGNGNSNYYFSYKQATLTSGTTNCDLTVPIAWQGHLNAGDYVEIVYQSKYTSPTIYDLYNQTGASNAGYTRVNLKTGSFFTATLADTKVVEGDTVNMNQLLPKNVKQVDFLKSIIKMFNLYLDQDQNVTNKLVVDTRDNFYSSGTTRYWDTKLDYLKPMTKTPMGELDARTYVFKYKEDKDYYNETYDKKYSDNYGLARYQVDNDFLKDERVTELIFSPTPLADYVGIDRIIPKIFTIDSQGNVSPKTSNLRILYYGGVKTTANPWSYVTTSGTTTHTTYPYSGHLDDPLSPTLDLSFDAPEEVFFTTTTYTDNNLINKYWRQALQEMTDPDSYMFTGWFRLTAQDIGSLDFRDLFYVDGQYFRLNKIYDYDPINNELTKCEFVKLKTYPAYVNQTKTIRGGAGGAFTSGSISPSYSQRTGSYGNSLNGGNTAGANNFVASSTLGCQIVGGKLNSIHEGCSYVSLVNTSGVTINPTCVNVSVINTSGVTIDESNVTYLNGAKVPSAYDTTTYRYTPSASFSTNLDNVVMYESQYYRIGNMVTVSGRIDLDPTTSGIETWVRFNLPVSSSLTNAGDLAGTAFCPTLSGVGAAIYANAATDEAKLQFQSSSTSLLTMYFSFTYQIK